MYNTLNHLKEFTYIVFSIALIFFIAFTGIALTFLPFGLGIYIDHSLQLNPFLSWTFTLFCYFLYWTIARHFNFINKPF